MTHTRNIISGIVLLLLLTSAGFPRSGQKDGKNEPEMLIKAARALEAKPLAKDAKDIRGWAVEWIIATDKMTV